MNKDAKVRSLHLPPPIFRQKEKHIMNNNTEPIVKSLESFKSDFLSHPFFRDASYHLNRAQREIVVSEFSYHRSEI